jgi:triacylglycerol lipase
MKNVLRLLSVSLIGFAFPAFAFDHGLATRYPVVLVHGLFGFDRKAGIDYFFRIPETLRRHGARVYVAQVDPVNTSAARGEELLAQVQAILAISGASRVNLIGHSQGAPTARYVAGVRPDLVASVTSVGGVNKGSAVADRLLALHGARSVVTEVLMKAMVGLIGIDLTPMSWHLVLRDLSSAGAVRFNRHFPQGVPRTDCGEGDYVVDGVRYYSWSGTAPVTNLFDPTDLPLGILSKAFSRPSDGLVDHCSSHLGQVIRDDYRMNHGDEINQLLGLVAPTEIRPMRLYEAQLRRLRDAGL